MNYSDLNLKLNTDSNSFDILPGQTINVLHYISIEDKNSIIQLALQNANENGHYNLIKLNMFFKLYLVYMYTDIEFTAEEKLDPVKIYDELESNGIMGAILASINPDEISFLEDKINETLTQKQTYQNTIASVINSFIEDLPYNAQQAKDIIEKFNPEDFKAVIDFATAANGNRPV